MKFLFLLLSLFLSGRTCLAQFPYCGTTWSRASSTASTPGPVGIPGVTWYWNYTNNIQATFVTNWVDQVSGVAFLWQSTRAANTRPTNSTSGVYFDAFNTTAQVLTNAALVPLATSSLSNIWLYVSFKPNHFSYNPIYIWGGSGTAHGYLNSSTAKDITFNTAGTPGAITLFTPAANVEYDLTLCVSNGLIWAWTNNVAVLTGATFGFQSGSNFDPTSLAGDRFAGGGGGNGYDGFIQEIAVGTNGFGGNFFTSVQASNLHWWRTNAVFFSAP